MKNPRTWFCQECKQANFLTISSGPATFFFGLLAGDSMFVTCSKCNAIAMIMLGDGSELVIDHRFLEDKSFAAQCLESACFLDRQGHQDDSARL
mgnify:CR=1 FL=1